MIFKTNIGELYLYVANNEGLKKMKIVKKAAKTNKCICVVIDKNYDHIVNDVYEVSDKRCVQGGPAKKQ